MKKAQQAELPGAPRLPLMVSLCERAMAARESVADAQRDYRQCKSDAIKAMKLANQASVAVPLPTGEIVETKWKHVAERDDLVFGKPKKEGRNRKKKGV